MDYLITEKGKSPIFTNWYDYENNYNEGMVVYDLINCKYTIDGINWIEIEIDHL